MFKALPHGCEHIDWNYVKNVNDIGEETKDLVATQQFATWTTTPGDEPAELALRKSEVKAQGLSMIGEPHLCQTDKNGLELWAVVLE